MNLQGLRQFWGERAPRERSLLTWAAAFVCLLTLYLTLIDPAFSAIARLQRSLPHGRAQAAELEALLAEVRALKARPAVAANSGLDAVPTLEQSLAGAGIKASRIVPLSNGALQLNFSNVSYPAWSVWLASAERELGLHAIAVTVRADSVPGNVDVELALRSGRD